MAKTIAINAEQPLGVALPERPADDLRIAGVTAFTTIDYPGALSAVAFLQGCPWKCVYCHNPWMQSREFQPGLEHSDWKSFSELLHKRKGLLDAVVFSGGEPCLDPALGSAMRAVKDLGMKVGLHTSGAYPSHLARVIGLVDWIGIDVKAPPEDAELYAYVAGRPRAAAAFLESFEMVRASGVDYEARTTAHPDFLTDEGIRNIARWLTERGAKTYALQIFRRAPGVDLPFSAVGSDYPNPETLELLKAAFEHFTLRRE